MTTKKTDQSILDKKKEQYASLSEEEKNKKRENKREQYASLNEEEKNKRKENWREWYAINIETITEKRKEQYEEIIVCECGLEVHKPSLVKHKKSLKHLRIINQSKREQKYRSEINKLVNSFACSNVQYTST